MKKNHFLFSLCLLSSLVGFSQSSNLWSPINETAITGTGVRQIIPQKYVTFHTDLEQQRRILYAAPKEVETTINASTHFITLPAPNGGMQRFRIVESPIMAPELSASFPDIRTYSIKGVDDVYANGKVDITEFGLHAMVLTINGDYYIDPFRLGNTNDYICYYTSDFVKPLESRITEGSPISESDVLMPGTGRKEIPVQFNSQQRPPAACSGAQLRTYRLAIACTGEYAVAATGSATPTTAQTLARVVTSVNRVDGVYEKEVAVRLVLISTTTLVLYTNASTDAFTGTANSNANTLIGLSQSVITSSIGTANFDIGHTFSTGGGGLANLGCVCSAGNKAKGITGSASPVGDPYDIDYVAHEMGHQFAGNHTFNAITSSCNGNRNAGTSVEPGSGVTIMAYAGICGANNIASNSIPYFHATSYDEIYNFVTIGAGNACAATSTTGNNPPVVTLNGSFAVPKSTPFSLAGTAVDPDGDAITYSWEETDAGVGSGGNWNSGQKPYFRSYAPVATGLRLFPKASVVQSSNYTGTMGEYLPTTAQTLNFRLTARDNKMGGGGVCYVNKQVVVDTGGPFVVLYPSVANISWGVNSLQTIMWDRAFTDQAPVSCDSVRILISYNSGVTYTTLAGSVPNIGFLTIFAPNLSVTVNTCRIRIEGKNNIFYDIGNNDFQISVDPTVGFEDLGAVNPVLLSVWPNPSSSKLTVSVSSLDPNELTDLQVCDISGRVVLIKSFSAVAQLHETLDVTTLENGLYFISVSNSGRKTVQRILKE